VNLNPANKKTVESTVLNDKAISLLTLTQLPAIKEVKTDFIRCVQ